MLEDCDDGRTVDIANRREAPEFFVVDEDLRMIFEGAADPSSPSRGSQPHLAGVIANLKQQLAERREPSAIAVLSATRIVRLLRLDAAEGKPHYAVFLERFAARSYVAKAAKKFHLSPREVDVLEGMMRGESTDAIAEKLGIGAHTVREHIRKIGRKTHVTKRHEIVAAVYGLAND